MSAQLAVIGWALIDFVWQGAVIGLVTAVILMAMRNASAEARYFVACVSLASCAAFPVLSMCTDSSSAAHALHAFLSAVGIAPTSDMPWRTVLQECLPEIITLWALGVAALLARFCLGLASVRRLRNSAKAQATGQAAWQARLDGLARRLRIRRHVRLGVLGRATTPMTIGFWRPVVLVPVALLTQMPVKLLDALLAHELAHIKRHDYLVNLIQSVIETLLFYHPVVWWLSRRIREERELIADGIATRAIEEPRDLALALQQLDTLGALRGRPPGVQLAAAASGGSLLLRIRQLVAPEKRALTWHRVASVVFLASLALVGSIYLAHLPSAVSASPGQTPGQMREFESRVEQRQPIVDDAERALLERNVEEQMASGNAP